jgi:alpha-1,3-rhamnosyltransferase
MIATQLLEAATESQAERDTVSVVVPSHNHARFIEATLRSIIAQTRPPAQLIIIDDGSTDDSPRLVERLLQNCPFPAELIARDNRGLCATLNEGLERSHGKYFAYLGSDDLWLPDFLSARIQLLNSRPTAVLGYGHAHLIDENNNIIDSTADWATYADGNARNMLLQTTAPMSPTVVYRRTALQNERWNESSRLEDYELYLRLSEAGDFAFDPRVLSAWRRHGSNVSSDQTLMLDEQLCAQREAARRFGFSKQQIETLQRRTRFNRAEDFLRVGQKSQALGLMVKNWRGGSPLPLARMFARLLIPDLLMRRRARRRRERARQKYGTL